MEGWRLGQLEKWEARVVELEEEARELHKRVHEDNARCLEGNMLLATAGHAQGGGASRVEWLGG